MGNAIVGESEQGVLIPESVFLAKRFKKNKTDLCLYLLNKSQGTNRKFNASFFRSRTYDQLVDCAVSMSDEVGGVGDDIVDLDSK